MKGLRWINYKGKEILFADMSAARDEQDVMMILNDVNTTILSQTKGSVLFLTNMEGGFVSPGAMKYYKESGSKVKDHIRAWAIFGVSPVKKMILELMTKAGIVNCVPFTSEEDAKNWLINL